MTTDLIKAIALLCQVIAGDNNDFIGVPTIIQKYQVECHAFYAKCGKDNSIADCMIARAKQFEPKDKK